MTPSDAVREAAKQVVRMLVAGDYAGVVELTRGRDMSEASIQHAIGKYGRTLKMPPDSAFLELDEVMIPGSAPPRWHVIVDLWTVEEGPSDLSVLMWISEPAPVADVVLLDIHVM